jgi:hypothetical protein
LTIRYATDCTEPPGIAPPERTASRIGWTSGNHSSAPIVSTIRAALPKGPLREQVRLAMTWRWRIRVSVRFRWSSFAARSACRASHSLRLR